MQSRELELGSIEVDGERIGYGDLTFLRMLDARRLKEVRDAIAGLIEDKIYYPSGAISETQKLASIGYHSRSKPNIMPFKGGSEAMSGGSNMIIGDENV